MAVVTYDDPAITYDEPSITYDGIGPLFDGVFVTVEAAFGYAPLDTSPVWQDITQYVRGIDISRGRTSEFTTYGPGTATLQLDNRDRRFDPEYTSGPYYGDLVPMVPVRITTTYSGSTHDLYYGYAQGWPTAYNTANTDAVATVNCVDATRLLENMALPQSDYYNAVIVDDPLHYWTFQEPTRDVQTDVIQGLQMTIPRFPSFPLAESRPVAYYSDKPLGADAMPISDPDVPFSQVYYEADQPKSQVRTFEVWFEYGQTVNTFQMSVFSGDQDEYFNVFVWRGASGITRVSPSLYSNIDNYYIAEYNVTYTPATGANHLVVTYDTSSGVIDVALNGLTIDSRSLTVGSINGPITVGGPFCQIEGDYISHYAFYEDYLPSARRGSHYLNGGGSSLPRADRRYFNAFADGGFPPVWSTSQVAVQDIASVRTPSTLLGYARQIETAEQGAFFVTRSGVALLLNQTTVSSANIQALFDDAGIDLPFAGVQVDSNTIDAIRNHVSGRFRSRFGDVELVASDASSITAYGEASESVDLTLFDVEADAQSVLDTKLARSKDPRTRIRRLDVNVRADVSMVPTIAQLELADDVTVSFTPTGVGDELWRAVRVQGVSHSITPERWDCQLYLAPGPIGTNGPLVVLDDDTYGKLSDGNKLG